MPTVEFSTQHHFNVDNLDAMKDAARMVVLVRVYDQLMHQLDSVIADGFEVGESPVLTLRLEASLVPLDNATVTVVDSEHD